VSSSQPANVQNKPLASSRIQPEHEQWRMGSGWRSRVTFLVARSGNRGACSPAGALSPAVRKELNLNLSAVHVNIRSRALRPTI